MATISYKNCQIPGDMADAVLTIEEEMSQIAADILTQLKSTDLATPAGQLALISAGIEEMLQYSNLPQYASTNTFCENMGLPQLVDDPTQQRLLDEKRVGLMGLALVNGIAYLKDNSGNIETVRRLYYALGRDLAKTKLKLANASSNKALVITETVRNVIVNPVSSNQLTLAEIRRLTGHPEVKDNDVVYLDNSASVKLKTFIGENINPNNAGLDLNYVTFDVFHFEAIKQTYNNIQNFKSCGFDSSQLSSALFGTALTTIESTQINNLFLNIQKNLDQITAQSKYILEHPTLTMSDRQTIIDNLLKLVIQINDALQTLRRISSFNVILLPDLAIFDKLSVNFTDNDIVELFELRPDITGIDFKTDPLTKINSLSSQPPGTPILSTLAINEKFAKASDLDIRIERTQARNNGLNIQVSNAVTNPTTGNIADINLSSSSPNFVEPADATASTRSNTGVALTVATGVVNLFTTDPQTGATSNVSSSTSGPSTTTQVAPTGGYSGIPSYDSPASIMFTHLNYSKTFKSDFLNANDLLTSAGGVLAIPLNALARVLESLSAIIDGLFASFNALTGPLIKRIEQLASMSISLTGMGAFENSFLKCAIGAQLDMGLAPFNFLSTLLANLQAIVNNALRSLFNAIADAIENLLCKPLGMLDAMIGKFNSFPLPCKISDFGLPQNIVDSLNRIRNIRKSQQVLANDYRRNLDFINANLILGPQQAGDMVGASKCAGGSTQSFLTAAQTIISFGSLTTVNPFKKLTPPFGAGSLGNFSSIF